MTTPNTRIEAMLQEMARTLTRLETRVCRMALHVGAQDAAGIPPTRQPQPQPNPKQLNLPI